MEQEAVTSTANWVQRLKQKLLWTMSEEIVNRLDYIRPYLQADGGDLELLSVSEDGLVTIRWIGRCSACPVSNVTLQSTVEQLLKQTLSSVKRVVAVSGGN